MRQSDPTKEPGKEQTRLMQCPGCWSAGMFRIVRTWECDCGEKMVVVDLRERPK